MRTPPILLRSCFFLKITVLFNDFLKTFENSKASGHDLGFRYPLVPGPLDSDIPGILIQLKSKVPEILIPLKSQIPGNFIPLESHIPEILIPLKSQVPGTLIPLKSQIPGILIPLESCILKATPSYNPLL